ncbi:hypothetical protein [Erwinia amylovora]
MYKRQHLVIVASQIGQVAVGQVACQVTAAVPCLLYTSRCV